MVRHGQTDPRRIGGELGPPLSDLGALQARRVAKRLSTETFNRVYTSDLRRAHDTAKAILRHHKNTPVTVTRDLREIINYHFLPGPMPADSVTRKSIQAERAAIKRFVHHLRGKHHAGERILIVSHGNFIRSLIPSLGRRQAKRSILIDITNTSVTVVEVWPSGEAILKLANCVRHLLPAQVTE